uniref:Ovule protein n=1 Tax=Heterorhabditis bacteriophora TaxID=37862 RepID=A0A1I7WZ84_HETBA
MSEIHTRTHCCFCDKIVYGFLIVPFQDKTFPYRIHGLLKITKVCSYAISRIGYIYIYIYILMYCRYYYY